MTYQIMFINGRAIAFEADSVIDSEGAYEFYIDGEVVAEFDTHNIAGYIAIEEYDENDP